MSKKTHIMIVDDDLEICHVLERYLSEEGYLVSVAHTGDEMRRIVEQSAVDLVLLDIGLPGEDGLALARSLRAADRGIGIIILTGRHETIDRVIGLEMGADDYLAKPFNLRELLARIRSISRRRRGPSPRARRAANRTRARFAGWLLDLAPRELRSPEGESVRLTGSEFDLLAAFVAHPNEVLTRDRLLDLTRERAAGPFDRTIDVRLGRLRRKLGEHPRAPQLIKTVRGAGYVFTAPVQWG